MTGAEGTSPEDRIVLHSSWTGIILAVVGAVLLVVVAVIAWAGAGATILTIVVTVLAAAAVVVVALDLPVASAFDRSGVTRHTPLRHHHLSWADITRLKRVRVGIHRTRQGRQGGLIANRGHRNYTLVDRLESRLEFDDLRRVLGPQADRLGLTDELRPPDGRPPTWLYRRAHWRPPEAG
ncbi:MAG: hypothetical protein AAF480_08115 [Actinomycetota bacterium]